MSIEALQATLAAEHAAVFVHGALGARTSASGHPGLLRAISAAYATHRERRGRLTARLRELGEEPVASEPGYRLPDDLTNPAAVRRRALGLERDCAATYAHLVATATDDDRALGVSWLVDTAVRELDFGGTPRPLPGL